MQIRTANPGDIPELVNLMQQLGYVINHSDLQANLECLMRSAVDEVLVADNGGRLLGCICLHSMAVLQSPAPLGRVSALVVEEACRSQGIGEALLARAEDHFRRQGCDAIEVTSSAHRRGAHRFYLAQGYQEAPCRFVRRLSAPS